MKTKIKIRKLNKEIENLETKKQEKDKVKELLKKRNELKFENLYAVGRLFKRVGSNIADWADKKNKEEKKSKKKGKKDKEVDLHEALFGHSDVSIDLGI